QFSGSVDFGRGTMRAIGGSDGVVARYSAVTGQASWALQIDGSGAAVSVNSVAVDDAGDVYAVGSFTGTVNVSGASLTSAGANDVLVAKYDGATGALIWSTRAGSTGQDKGYAVVIDSNGDVLVSGYFTGNASFGSSTLTSGGASDVFLAKYAG